jgi:CubicO group peptidase (beta-lactamase class C family)
VHILLRNFRYGTHDRCREIRLLLFPICVIGLSSAISLAGQQQSGPSDAEVTARVRSYLAPFKESGNLTGAVLIARHGRVLLRRSYGLSNYELRVPNSPRTRFHIASVSKAFTAIAILQLQEQGRLKLSDPVSRFMPDFPRGGEITIDNLLTHTSGIRDINDLPDYGTFARNHHDLSELVSKFAHLPLQFQPGTKYSYSNSNYNLLALILETVNGESYSEYLLQHILGPAGMNESGHDADAANLVPFAAAGYVPAGVEGYEKAPYVDWSTKTGNGSLYSTVDDLYRFDRALNTDRLLKDRTRQTYFVEGEGSRYGWYIGRRLGHRVMTAKGRSPGFTAELDRFPDDDLTIILLSNSYSTVTQDPIAESLAAVVFGQRPSIPTMHAVTTSPSILESCAGRYQFGADYFTPDANFTLSSKPDYLLMQIGDSLRPLVPLQSSEFLEREFFGRVVMQKDNLGKVIGLKIRYGTKDFWATKLGTASATVR